MIRSEAGPPAAGPPQGVRPAGRPRRYRRAPHCLICAAVQRERQARRLANLERIERVRLACLRAAETRLAA